MKNAENKRKLLTDGTFDNFCKEGWELRQKGIKLYAFDYENPQDYYDMEQMRLAKKEQRKRISRHLDFMIAEHLPLVFVTLTFDDIALSKKATTRKEYVKTFMRQAGITDYICNIDYGAENEREHYHAIVQLDENVQMSKNGHKGQVDIQGFEWKYGYRTYKPIKLTSNTEKLSAYMAKLVNHSLKVKNQNIMTSRTSNYAKFREMLKHEKLWS